MNGESAGHLAQALLHGVTMGQELERFQGLLRELFQFDCADLDFGIYRILNARRGLFEDWLTERLPQQVRAALSKGVLRQDTQQAERMRRLVAELREEYGEDCIDGDGKLTTEVPNRSAKAKEYRQLWKAQQQAGGETDSAALEADIYNRLYDFFRRYYEDGDFLSLRRYGTADRYAVPYNGEEVLLHWANKDQYYIKTGEHFTDYRFRAGSSRDCWMVEFKLVRAEADRDNTRSSDKRFFFFDVANAGVDADGRVLSIPVHFRAATEAEKTSLGNRNVQDKLNAEAEQKLLAKKSIKAQAMLATTLAQNVSDDPDKPQSLLGRHLRRYTRKNTSDFFIHKDLGGFLTRELDYYLKAEVLKLDALLAGGEHVGQAWLQRLSVMREIGAQIIGFLAQVENFQKSLFEKRKFITECHWCLTLDHVERAGLTDDLVVILNGSEGGKRQKDEWKKLFAIDEVKAREGQPGWKDKVTAAFLRSQPFLVLDTAFMPREFTDKLLGSFDDLDAQTNGVLVHSENFQALNLLMERYREQVQCVYIDPPYNTGPSEIIYKNNYKHSSWLSLMYGRLQVSHDILNGDGRTIVAIDENEQERLGCMLDLFSDQTTTCVSIVHNPRGIQGRGFSYTHEFAYFMMPRGFETASRALDESKEKPLMKTGSVSRRAEGRSMFYPLYVKDSRVVRIGAVPEDDFHPGMKQKITKNGEIEVWPVDSEGGERKWRYKATSLKKLLDKLSARPGRDGRQTIYLAKDAESFRTVWTDARYNAAEYGSTLLKNMLPKQEFTFPKSVYTVSDCLTAAALDPSGTVLDYFAGSGTTGHAVVDLNRGDDGDRKYVLAEMGAYFDSVLKPRIEKVIYSKDWKDGKPVSREGSSHLVKYFRMESYEDALSNLVIRDDGAGQSALDLLGDAYRLGYWLDFDTQGSATRLNIEALAAPFEYSLTIHDGREAQVKPVDLPETFAYLIGLIVERRRVLDREGRRYVLYVGSQRENGLRTAVLWRDIRDWRDSDFEAERRWIAKQNLFEGCVVVYVNGDSAIEGAQSLDPVFKARMFAPVH
jgi:adenine-specific DNA-methyltransferase